MMEEKIRLLQSVDWEFSDYRGASSFPADINSLHWYPAPFVPHIPSILIHTLTSEGDIVLDPYAGAGVTLIEAARLRRGFIGLDINPYAVNIMKAKFRALKVAGEAWYQAIENALRNMPIAGPSTKSYCRKMRINEEVFKWFEKRTLERLCSIHRYVISELNREDQLLKKVLFSSILNRCCSQREHYTYVTDGCYPHDVSLSVDATKLFLNQAKLVAQAVETFRRQYEMVYGEVWRPVIALVTIGDARDISLLRDASVDIVVTSPPYLGVNDYVRSMRLTRLFFPEKGTKIALENEVGARGKRHRKNAYDNYITDIDRSFSEVARVLKKPGFLCFTIGQGKGRVYKGDATQKLLELLQLKYGFCSLARFDRIIKFRRIQVRGVEKEHIIVLGRSQKPMKGCLN